MAMRDDFEKKRMDKVLEGEKRNTSVGYALEGSRNIFEKTKVLDAESKRQKPGYLTKGGY